MKGAARMLMNGRGPITVGAVIHHELKAVVMAAQEYQASGEGGSSAGVVLAYSETEGEAVRYHVWSVGCDGSLSAETSGDEFGAALNAYTTRVVDRLYGHFGTLPPTLDFRPLFDR